MAQVVWSIAGFDPSSGAGVTADLMTFAAHGLYGCAAVTALTVQSTRGVAGVELVRPELLRQTLEQLLEDLPPRGVKIGMLGSAEQAVVVGRFLRGLECPVVLDPVLRSSSGRALYPVEALEVLEVEVLPFAGWITPNWAELGLLSGRPVRDAAEVEVAVRALLGRQPHLHTVVTGGDQSAPIDVLFAHGREGVTFPGVHVETSSTHGTGCAFSSALLAELVGGVEPEAAVRGAKAYVAGALEHTPGLGGGKGPLGLLWPLRKSTV